MAQVTLPRILDAATSRRTIPIAAETLSRAIDELMAEEPGLRVHLFDESGDLRPHVLCFVDGVSTRLDKRNLPISDDTRIDFLQAVSGG